MNLIIMFILNILSFSLSYTSSQNALNLQRHQSRAGSIRNINESNSFRQTPVFAQGETPLFAKNMEFSRNDNDDDIPNFIVAKSVVASPIYYIVAKSAAATPISPSLELILEETFDKYYYSHPNNNIPIPDKNEEKKRVFSIFLIFLKIDSNFKIDNNFFKFNNDNIFENFCQIYKIPFHQDFNEEQRLEFQKYIKHEEAKEKIRQRCRIEKMIDSFIENNKKIETA